MTAPTIAIVDYGLGNLFSIARAAEHAGLKTKITDDPAVMADADGVLLPGVGAFGDAMAALAARDLTAPLKNLADGGKPLIGICLGMQLLMEESHEFGRHRGLGLIPGTVERLSDVMAADGRRIKVPQVGWNMVLPTAPWAGTPLEGIAPGTHFYFVHSYHVAPRDPSVMLSLSRYGDREFCSSLRRGNIFACQFHPERSGEAGLALYRNIAAMLSKGRSA